MSYISELEFWVTLVSLALGVIVCFILGSEGHEQ